MKKMILNACLSIALSAITTELKAQTGVGYGPDLSPVAEPVIIPNPVINEAQIILPHIPENRVYLYVLDFTGRILYNAVYAPGGNQLIVDLTMLENGFYNIRLIEDGMFPLNIKFIKE